MNTVLRQYRVKMFQGLAQLGHYESDKKLLKFNLFYKSLLYFLQTRFTICKQKNIKIEDIKNIDRNKFSNWIANNIEQILPLTESHCIEYRLSENLCKFFISIRCSLFIVVAHEFSSVFLLYLLTAFNKLRLTQFSGMSKFRYIPSNTYWID